MKRGLLLSIGTLAGVIGFAAGTTNAGLTPMNHEFTYQGRLDIAGVPYNGVAQFEFRIFDSAVGGAVAPAPAPAVLVVPAVSVIEGVFTVNLNYGPTAFVGDQRFLDIRVDTTAPYGDVYTTLTPRQLLRTTPYASFALSAGSISGVVPIANGGTSAVTPAAAVSNLTAGAMTLSGANIDVTASLFAGAANSVQLTNNQVSTFGGDGLEQIRLWGSSYGEIMLNDSTGNDTTALMRANLDSGGQIILGDAAGATRVQLLGQSAGTGGEFSLFDDDGTETVELLGAAIASEGARMQLRNAAGTSTIELDADSGDAAFVGLRNTLGSNRITMDGDSAGAGLITLFQNDGSTGISLDADAGTNVGGFLSVRDSVSATRVSIDGESVGTGGEISLLDDDGTETIEILAAEAAAEGGSIKFFRADGTGPTIELDGHFVSGAAPDGRIITDELQITGGSDLSEQFDVKAFRDEGKVEPGTVVCIDPDHTGKLLVSSKAYDRTVAGIISGAGGIETGMYMGQRGSEEADGQYPIALTGRVYVRATTANGSIQPGDLLTTSDIPGLAMKVTDYTKAHGAIIGKAMMRLDEKTGLVLVLVSLQ